MKAVQIVKPNQLEVIDVEKPVIDPKNNVLVKMTAAGICGSDVGIYHGTNAAATYPRIIGHEMVGVVAEVGDNVSSLKIGDRIIINQVTSWSTWNESPAVDTTTVETFLSKNESLRITFILSGM